MKKENYLVRTLSLILAGCMIMTGCGSSFDTGGESGSTATAEASETYAPSSADTGSDGGVYEPSENAGAASDSDYGYAAAADEADEDYSDYVKGDDSALSQSANSYVDSVYDYEKQPEYPNTE